jgi:hypothetical protein
MSDETALPAKRGRGRPRKADLKKKTKGNRGQVGRPKGDAAIINEYKARMLASPKSAAVLEKIFDVALDDEHKNQASCMKLIADRIVPVSFFAKDGQSKGVSGISISINTAAPDGIVIDGEVVEDV